MAGEFEKTLFFYGHERKTVFFYSWARGDPAEVALVNHLQNAEGNDCPKMNP